MDIINFVIVGTKCEETVIGNHVFLEFSEESFPGADTILRRQKKWQQ